MADSIYASAYSTNHQQLPSLFDDLVRVETRLYNALNDALRTHHGLATSQFEFLRFLRWHPAARVGDIASAFAVGVGATSKGINRLEERGWVRRATNPSDQRSSFLHLTPAAEALVDAAEVTFERVLATLVGEMVDAEALAVVGEALSAVRSSLEQAGVGTPVG